MLLVMLLLVANALLAPEDPDAGRAELEAEAVGSE